MKHDEWHEGIKVACYDPETGITRFADPTGLAIHKYEGPMIHFKNGQTDILVTPNHRMWTAPKVQWKAINPKVDRSWRIETAEKIFQNPRSAGWRVQSTVLFEDENDSVIDLLQTPLGNVSEEAWARFIGYFISEGSTTVSTCKSGEFRKDGSPIMRDYRRILLAQKPGKILDDMRNTLDELGLHYGETIANAGVVNLTIWNKDLWTWLRASCGESSATKRIPKEFQNSNINVRRALYKALMDGDGGRSGGSWRYSTVSKQLSEQMQLLAISLGYGASVSKETMNYRAEKRDIYRVWIRSRLTGESHLKKQHVHEVWYEGTVYCFQVPTGIYVTRRNGKIAIQGNTFFGDAEVGTLATAKSLDRPTELSMLGRQRLWAEQAARYGLVAGVRGMEWTDAWGELKWNYDNDPETSEPLNTHVSIGFPDIVERNVTERVDAVVKAATLGGTMFAGTLTPKYATRQLLTALGEQSVEEVMADLFPEDEEEVAKQTEDVRREMKNFLELVKEFQNGHEQHNTS